ncbi:hypothetical protein BO71DRAFT_450038 [Aspergillus ellipticus CBS 707.79]|uniref:LysM domain-containing protein n=1 Tax=Aspergillus ellipticus CBS 707.79 TaxID=1448320 RepID=A0A319DB41_9EURO|nr:hypothetical protein BO71DRAFT_450038 [Aspergillus ellipticus CBS 707.79]
MYFKTLSSLSLLIAAATATCDKSTLNTTVGNYIVSEGETIAEVSNAVDRGICDIARLNRMADAKLPLIRGEELLIPPETCTIDNSTCLIVPSKSGNYADCVKGGPHTYYTLKGDTIRYIALKLNIAVEALSATAQGGVSDPDAEVQVDNFMKVPQCSPSRCTVEPVQFTYGTYKDIAEKRGVTVGQIMGFNPTYNHSDDSIAGSAVITIPTFCEEVGNNISVIS